MVSVTYIEPGGMRDSRAEYPTAKAARAAIRERLHAQMGSAQFDGWMYYFDNRAARVRRAKIKR